MLTPATIVIIILVVLQRLAFSDGVLAWIAVFILSAFVAFRPLFDMSLLFEYLQDLCHGKSPAPPEIQSSGAASTLSLALAQLRRDMRQTLKATEDVVHSHEEVFDTLPDAVIILDAEHKIIRANAASRGLFGKNLVGHDITNFVRQPQILEALDQDNNTVKELDFSVLIPVERQFTLTLQPMTGEIEKKASILMSFHDITTIRRLEEMRADFVANASHELRTPLASLIGFIDTLQGPAREDTEARERFLKIMAEQASRMARLIEDLLSLSRIEMNEHTQPSHAVDIKQIINSVIEGLEPIAKDRKVKFKVTASEALPLVRGEYEELMQVLQNLIENALKYTLEDTDVSIHITALSSGPVSMPRASQDPVISIAIHDQGEGISQDHIPRLTERFYRVDSARSRQMGGTGLGLAIVKHVLNRHRGSLNIESTLGQGSVFTAYLPVCADEDALQTSRRTHNAVFANDQTTQPGA